MLTANLVRARCQNGRLLLSPLDERLRQRILGLGRNLVEVTRSSVGQTRDDFEQACKSISVAPRDRKLTEGLLKLIEDRCEWEAHSELDPLELRRQVFEASSRAWKSLPQGASFDRERVLAEVAQSFEVAPERIEQSLFSDLRGSHRLLAIRPLRLEELPELYHRAEAQAVLLRATRLEVRVRCASALGYRHLFHRLKFLQLLFAIEQTAQGYKLVIDGPFSMFESGTKYGFKMAMLLPVLDGCDDWSLSADVRWGKDRRRVRFDLQGGRPGASATLPERPLLAESAQQLLQALEAVDSSAWTVSVSTTVLTLPGAGVCIPDLELRQRKTGAIVYVEVMGFWSRDALWKRIQLVERGLKQPILFVVSEKLRVSEAALPEEAPSALYVYKRTPSAARVLEAAGKLVSKGKRVRKRRPLDYSA